MPGRGRCGPPPHRDLSGQTRPLTFRAKFWLSVAENVATIS
jgi:hypothetical protein